MNQKKISFVIPAYNEERYIGKCLDAIVMEAQGRGDIEIIVADNNSSDQTPKVVSHYPGVKLVQETKRGANRTREAGFRESKGGLVAFLDADTEMPQGWIAHAEKEFEKDKDLVCVSGPFIYYDLPLWTRVLVRVFYLFGYLIHLVGRIFFRRTTVIQGGNYIVRRTALERIGGHDVNITFYGDDTDLAIRLSKVGRVKFSFGLPMLTSGRRLAKEGLFTMGVRYGINNLWMVFFRRPFSTTSEEVRFGEEGTVYRPERKWKERVTAVWFSALLLLFFGGFAYVVYKLVVFAISLGFVVARLVLRMF